MELKPLSERDLSSKDREILMVVEGYRQFVGKEAAFHIEYPWWPGRFDNKEEENDFFLDENNHPDDYETLSSWLDEASEKQSDLYVENLDLKSDKKFWKIVSVILFLPYVALYILISN